MKFNKNYYEKYALLTIVDCLKLNLNNFRLSDKPDIRNDVDSIGIEVTRAITTHQGYTNALSSKYFGKGKSGSSIKEKIEEEHPNFKGYVGLIDGETVFISSSKGLTDTQNRLNVAKQSILDKERKRHSYKLFDRNYLYVFLGTAIFSEYEITDFLSDLAKEVKFDGIFMNCIDKIGFHKPEGNNIFSISDQKLKKYKVGALI